jgi:hypothetical protein
MVLALVVAVMVAAPVGAKKKVWDGLTCAEVWGTDYKWTTSGAGATYPEPLTLTKGTPTACIDLTTDGGDFTVKFTNANDRADVTGFYASVRDSVPGSQCHDGELKVVSNTTGEDLPLDGVPASGILDTCGDEGRHGYSDGDEALALWVGLQFKGKPVDSPVGVTITYKPTYND